ncbi:MAG: hypothetical protein V1652_00770 [bacterium]
MIYITVIAYIFYKNGLQSSKRYPNFKQHVIAILFLLALLANCLAVIFWFSAQDLPASVGIFFMNTFLILPALTIGSLVATPIDYMFFEPLWFYSLSKTIWFQKNKKSKKL